LYCCCYYDYYDYYSCIIATSKWGCCCTCCHHVMKGCGTFKPTVGSLVCVGARVDLPRQVSRSSATLSYYTRISNNPHSSPSPRYVDVSLQQDNGRTSQTQGLFCVSIGSGAAFKISVLIYFFIWFLICDRFVIRT